MSITRSLSDYESQLLADIEQFGFQVTTVVDPDGGNPPFSYSVGFTQSLGQGEVIVVGLAPESGNWVIHDFYEKVREEGIRFADGLRISEILSEAELVCRAVPQAKITRDYLNSAIWFHRRQFGSELAQVFQLVWPDPRGNYPWDEDCDQDVIAMQTPLYETRLNS